MKEGKIKCDDVRESRGRIIFLIMDFFLFLSLFSGRAVDYISKVWGKNESQGHIKCETI